MTGWKIHICGGALVRGNTQSPACQFSTYRAILAIKQQIAREVGHLPPQRVNVARGFPGLRAQHRIFQLVTAMNDFARKHQKTRCIRHSSLPGVVRTAEITHANTNRLSSEERAEINNTPSSRTTSPSPSDRRRSSAITSNTLYTAVAAAGKRASLGSRQPMPSGLEFGGHISSR
jgi:hypothetical protein